MADIQSAAQWLGKLVVQEATYLSKVESKVKSKVKELRDELDWIHCFLSEADATKYDNAMARRWVARIREFAYEAEDTIERFLINVNFQSTRRRDILSRMKKYTAFLWKSRSLHQIGSKIDSLTQQISSLTTKLQTYGINLKTGESSSSWISRNRTSYFTSRMEENIIDQRKNDLDKVVNELVSETKRECRVVSICGDAGVGKTFLAKKIFHNEKIRRHFEAFAWAYVPYPCQSSAVQQDLLSTLTSKSKEQISQMTDNELEIELCKVLRKYKCFVVLDGLWGSEVWDSLKKSFPSAGPDFQSKLLITNQLEEVAKHVHPDANIYHLKCLDGTESKKLLEEILRDNLRGISEQKDLERGKDSSSKQKNPETAEYIMKNLLVTAMAFHC